MKKYFSGQLDRRTFRLALSYVAIIMVLCIGFSVLFYQSSTQGLNLSLQTTTEPKPQDESGTKSLTLQADGGAANLSLSGESTGDISQLNAQLEQQVASFRRELLYRLLLFNAGALLVGTVISYFLARRTLRPIEEAMALQARFSSDASHELRTPLAALRTNGEVALRDTSLTLAQAKKVIKNSVEQTYKLERLADALLRLAREDKRSLVKRPVSLVEIANEAMNATITRAQAKRITIEENAPHVLVLADRENIIQAVRIVLDNAIKYSPKGTHIHIEGSSEGAYATLRIKDEGMGIAAHDLPHIFERFYRADASRNQDGYGLGLSIAHKIVSQHGGTISAQSSAGHGSVFIITLPLAKL